MVVEFTTTCAIVDYHHLGCEFEPHSWRGVLDKALCDKVCQCDGSSSVKIKGNCYIDIGGIYGYHCL
jgi:hypothetical protein